MGHVATGVWVATMVCFGAAGCGGKDSGPQPGTPGFAGMPDGGSVASEAGTGGSLLGGELDDRCGAINETAEVGGAPADIIFAIDTSGSMDYEFCQVAMNLTAFADGIGPQTRVTTVYRPGSGFLSALGGIFGVDTGGCGGEDPFESTALAADDSRYLHVDQTVDSHNAFEVLLAQYGSYADFLRPDSPVHVVVVTDDTSDTPAADFRTQMEQNLGRPFYFHAIAYTGDSMGNTGCQGDTGQQYLDLAAETGGEQLSICALDWSLLFAELEAAVEASSPIPCTFDIPEPPPGENFSPDLVGVRYTAPGTAAPSMFPRAESADACGQAAAWHFDSPTQPTRIEFCPAACAQVGDGGKLGIAFGCSPILL